ncbi:splicing factor, suppressor of white-apricot homolog isoform X2 [Olea europaea var. sylvestris]|uniref:splicing factor, suppressor of white-apricot homolog isoform X2 n=1 Tax=Olea europaea var. sylvestris TaxID=158386 RepID=UPI000C1D11AA|nr:splicing factor, suppressor of white-apricot homolog isoform X2 [Olea europaea var. sylvestris]XP_022859713.1 splicing factor, suppressor of white-apricot homolog isoform X2 [Olea europaea var. sylvestris]
MLLLPFTKLQEFEKPTNTGGYRAVAFSYGSTDDSADQRNADAGLESSRFCPSFPVPDNLSQSLPPTEKLHQIISRTATFVSRHGSQSEIVLRVKQGDNPIFGFLMPDHRLHAYFRYLVDHPELLHSDIDGNSQNEGRKAGSEHNDLDSIGGGALSLLGSVYGSGEEEDGEDNAGASGEPASAVDKTISCGLEKIESSADAADKYGAVSKNPLSNKSNVLAVKKNSLIGASKAGSAGGTKKKVDSASSSIAAEKSKGSALGVTPKVEPLVLEPPSDLKRLIYKIVELITKYGKQFEATLLEQDFNKERFLFLLPSNQYHPYYLKVLQKAQESKVNGKGFHFGKDDPVGRGMDKKASVLGEGDFSFLDCHNPFEFDRKEKFKMTIGKSKKDAQETECRGTQQEFGVTVDAASAAAILQAATRGIKHPNLGIISSTPLNVYHGRSSDDNQATSLGTLPYSQPHGMIEKSDRNEGHNVSGPATKTIARTAALEAAGEADSSEAHLTKEQKLKAERLQRAKMFVAMLKSGAVPYKTGTSRGSSLEPQELGLTKSAGEVNLSGKQREGSSAPVDLNKLATDEKPERDNFAAEHIGRVSRRKYRSRSGEDEDEDENGEKNAHNEGKPRRKYRSRPGRHEENDVNGEETEMKHSRREHRSHSSSLEDGEKSEEDRERERSKRKHRSRISPQGEDDYEDREREEKDRKRSRKKHRSHHSSKHSRKRHSSKQHSCEEEDEEDEEETHNRHSGKKHRSSHHSRCSRRHKERYSLRERESRDYTKEDGSSDEEHQRCNIPDKHKKGSDVERDELEEGEISSKASGDSRGIASAHVSREPSLDASNLYQRAPSSQPQEAMTEVSDDLRAKIRAMLMATR